VVNPSLPVKTVKELIEYAKANPGKLSFASANTSGIVAGETLTHWAEIQHAACALQGLTTGKNIAVISGRSSRSVA
jgi:tripartite-type tricarboxylate transporter receptor subunit TctC